MLDAFDRETEEWFAAVDDDGPDRPLRCRRCGHVITRRALAVAVGGAARHTCTNPAGITFLLRMFSAAPGCRLAGPRETAHSWFPPFGWQIACCGGCGAHCGWGFGRADATRFLGLIEDRLTEDST
ncbi:MAG: hypothetical protein ACU85V_14265 [Gammaproteobacteria bacterium]